MNHFCLGHNNFFNVQSLLFHTFNFDIQFFVNDKHTHLETTKRTFVFLHLMCQEMYVQLLCVVNMLGFWA